MRVVIVGMYAPYPGPFDGVEVWGVNHCYTKQDGLSRLYFMDSLPALVSADPEFVERVNALGIPIWATREYAEIPLSRAYPKDDVVKAMCGRDYFTSTIAYMIAHALFEGAKEITLHRILVGSASIDYWLQKPCLDFWAGMALGMGVRLRISDDSLICRPAPWEPAAYGYEENTHFDDANEVIVSALRAAVHIPIDMRPV